MNENLQLCLNQALFSLVAGEYYQANLARFSGNVTLGSLTLQWQAQGAPAVTLTGGTGPNISLVFSNVILSGQGISGSATLTVTVTGTLSMANGILSLTGLVATVTGDAGFINNLIAGKVNALIAAQYASQAANIPIPTLQNLLNTQLTVQLQTASVTSGQCQVAGSLTYQGSAPSWPPPPPLCNSVGTPSAGLALNGAGVGTALQTQTGAFPMYKSVYDTHTYKKGILGHFGYGVQGSVTVAFPQLSISGSSATASTYINFNLEGGIEAFGEWIWVPLTIPTASVALAVGLVTNQAKNQANVQVQGVQNIQFAPFNFPGALSSVADDIEGMIENDIANALTGMIVGQEFTVFTLPASLPGTPFPASLSFGQIGFLNSGVGVVVNVTGGATQKQLKAKEVTLESHRGANGNGNEFFVKLAWAALWQPTGQNGAANPYYLPTMILNGVTSNNVHVGPLGTVTVDDVPTVELFQSKNLSPLPFKSGSVGISFTNVTLTGMNTLSNQGLQYTPDPTNPNSATIVATMGFGPVAATGSYVVSASGLAFCALDTAGGLLSLPGLKAGAPSDSPDLDTMLDAARAQRTRIWQTPNGGQLMDSFYEHNEVYNGLYSIAGSPLVVQWAGTGTQQNASATYGATQQGGNVNDAQGVFNGNSFIQALNLHTTCIHAAKNAGSNLYPLDAATYQAAADAILDFEGTVGTTGNTSSQSTPMTVDQVFTTVSNGNTAGAKPPRAQRTDAEQHHIAQFRHSIERFDAARLEAASSNEVATIFQGAIMISTSPGTLTMTATIDFSGSIPVATVTAMTASFPVPVLNIDVSAWQQGNYQSIGQQLLPAYENAGFLGNLVHDKLQNAVESSTVTSYLTTVVNDALAKALGALPGGN